MVKSLYLTIFPGTGTWKDVMLYMETQLQASHADPSRPAASPSQNWNRAELFSSHFNEQSVKMS